MKGEERCLWGWEGGQEPAWTGLETGREGTGALAVGAVGAGELAASPFLPEGKNVLGFTL